VNSNTINTNRCVREAPGDSGISRDGPSIAGGHELRWSHQFDPQRSADTRSAGGSLSHGDGQLALYVPCRLQLERGADVFE